MNCAEMHPLLHAYTDGELDLVRSLDVEKHLHTCPACATLRNSILSLRSALRSGNLAHPAPPALRERIRRDVAGVNTEPRPRPRERRPWSWQWLMIGAAAGALFMVALPPAGISPGDRLTDDLIAGHVRSLMAGHLTDVVSSDQHTVKPWFNGKLDFAPEVRDLAAQGFPLVGGRLDYLDGRTVAALVYQRNKHFINVFVWPENKPDTARRTELRRGYAVMQWNAGSLHYSVVSDLNEKELGEFADDLRK